MTTEKRQSLPGQPGVSVEQVAEDVFLEVLTDAVTTVEAAGIEYVLMGGFASAALGRPRWTHDIDFFVKPEAARSVLAVLAEHGFVTEETDPDWIYKAFKKGVLVDVIFCSADEIYLDASMLERAQRIEFKGTHFRVIPPEDLLVIKARVFKEETARHWFDALGIVREAELDWEYLVSKAREKPEKPLSLLLFARSAGLNVPSHVIQKLWDAVSKRTDGKGGPNEGADDYLVARIHERLAQEGYEIDVCIEGGTVVLSGDAVTEEQHSAILQLARDVAQSLRVVDEIAVTRLAEPEEAEQLT